MGTLVFILVLSVLVMVHEYGHLLMAKALGVKVERFAFGFGPKLVSFIRKGTEYAICLIPLGGYVKMAGDERAAYKGEKDEFFSKPIGHRALIVLSGPVVNYLFAFACFCVVFMIGYPARSTVIGEVIKGYPVEQQGLLKVGDKIVSIDAVKMESWENIQEHISQAKKEQFVFGIERGDTRQTVTLNSVADTTKNVFGQTINVRRVGIAPNEEVVLLKYGFLTSVAKAGAKILTITATTYKALYLMLTGAMSAKEGVTGPIGIFFIISRAAELGFSYVVYIMAVISASLAIFNLLPLPVLDGGHLLFFAVEKVRRKPLSEKTEEVIYRLGFSLIIALAVFVFYSDFARYGILDKIMYWKH